MRLGHRAAGTRSVLGNRSMVALLGTWGIWISGDWACLIAVSVLALHSGGPAAVGLVGAARVLPAAVLSGVVAGVSDRLPRALLLAVVNASWCVIALVLAWFALGRTPLGALIAVVAVGSAVSAVLRPCLQATVPTLVYSPADLIVANSAMSTTEGLGTVFGPVLAALLLARIGPVGVFVGLAVLYAAAAVLSSRISSPSQPARIPGPRARRRRIDWSASLRGFRVLTAPGVRTLFTLIMLQTSMRGLLNVFVILLVSGGTRAAGAAGGDARAGALFAAIGVGGLVGAAVSLALRRASTGVARFALGVALWGLPVALIGLWTRPGVALVALGVVGLGNAFADIYGYTLLNLFIPDHVAGRVWGAFHAGSAAMVALGSLLAPLLVSGLGLSGAMLLTGALLTLAPVAAIRGLRGVSVLARPGGRNAELLRRVALLAPLSVITLEQLARSAREILIQPGEVVLAEGDPAEEFFVVASGEVSVWQHGEELRRLGPDASFGEIGLLQAVPRTATVRADQATRLVGLNRESFVAAVTGHRLTDEHARSTVEQHLAADLAREPPTAPADPPTNGAP